MRFYLDKSCSTLLLPPKVLRNHCLQFLLGHKVDLHSFDGSSFSCAGIVLLRYCFVAQCGCNLSNPASWYQQYMLFDC